MPSPAPMIALLHVHPSRAVQLREPDQLRTEPDVPLDLYTDSFGNVCSRFVAPAGRFRLFNSTVLEDSGEPDAINLNARQIAVQDLPTDVLRFLIGLAVLRSRSFLGYSNAPVRQARSRDGSAYRQSATGCINMSRSATITRGQPKRPWMCTQSARGFAATFSIWQLLSADAWAFPHGTQPVIWET
jgi:hypothetical protein